MRSIAPRAAVAALALLLAGCSGSPAGSTAYGGGTATPSGAAATTRAGNPTPTPGAAATIAPGSTPAPTASAGETEEPSQWGPGAANQIPLDVTLNRSCARRGDEMEAHAVTLKHAQITFGVSYADNDFTPDFTWVPSDANPTGEHTWRWVLRPTTPLGPAQLVVVAGKGNKGANYKLPFEVAESC